MQISAVFYHFQAAQTQIVSLRSDDVPLLLANDIMDDIIFDEESSDVSSDNAAAILQSLPSMKGCLYCGEHPDHTTVWSGYYCALRINPPNSLKTNFLIKTFSPAALIEENHKLGPKPL